MVALSFSGDEGFAPVSHFDSGFRGWKFQKADILIYFQRRVRALYATTAFADASGKIQ
jgi:hypothetical protein